MRTLIKTLFDAAVRKVPDNVAIRALNILRERYRITDMVLDSNDNLIEGTLDDLGLFRPLMLTGSFKGEGAPDLVENLMRDHRRGTYIDIGANVGMTTIPFARRFNWDFYAFEPEPTIYRRLRCNLVRNDVDQKVGSFNLGLSDHQGTFTLKRARGYQGDNWLAIGNDGAGNDVWDDVPIEVDALESIFADKKLIEPIVVKIDTQGAEPLVVAGGHNIIDRAQMIALEFWPKRIRQMGADPLSFYDDITSRFQTVTATDVESSIEYSGRLAIRQRIENIVLAATADYLDIVLSK
jgi:FkbM family methyltransferase